MPTLEKLHEDAAKKLSDLIDSKSPPDASLTFPSEVLPVVDAIADYTIAKATQTVLYAAEEANRAQPTPKP